MKEIGTVEAYINKVQTTLDGGARITIDVGAESVEVVKKLIDAKLQEEKLLYVSFVED